MEAPFEAFLTLLAGFTCICTGVRPPLSTFKPAREGGLGLSAFVKQDAPGAAKSLRRALPRCQWEGVPLLEGVEEKNGWLLFAFTGDFFEMLLKIGQSLPPATAETYWGNRLRMLERKGPAPCPRDPRVRQALFLAFWAWGMGRYPKELPQKLLNLTHVSPPAYRLELENHCGSVARALLGFMGDAFPCALCQPPLCKQGH